MTDKTEAMRLAQALNNRQECEDEAADELRRLSAENERIGPLAERVLELKAQRDALLEALKPFVTIGSGFDMDDVWRARAAIKVVEESK